MREFRRAPGRRPKSFQVDVPYIDYKDVELLSKALSPQGKLMNRKRNGADAKLQHRLRRAVYRARFMALLGYGN